jgi:Zn-dependent peptidase ImmA (M78 family)/transcriptional regulator with XRE-family HTH domain
MSLAVAPKRIQAIVRPQMLIWAREMAGLSISDVARKARVTEERLESWEQGERRPTVKQLRKLAQVYKRPLAAFYLQKPPPEPSPLHDFRRLSPEADGKLSPELRVAIRLSRYRHRVALDLFEIVEGKPPKTVLPVASTSEDPEEIGARIRQLLEVTPKMQVAWGDGHEAFRAWRTALERTGVLVFQATNVDVAEMRGFSIDERPLPVIVVNVKDYVHARIFTLLHELAHLLIQTGGLCDLEEDHPRGKDEHRIEVFCNAVAGVALIPREALLQDEIVRNHGPAPKWSDAEIKALARRYKASREAVLRRLLTLGCTTRSFYLAKREEFRHPPEPPAEGFVPPYRRALSSTGPLFANLVLSGYQSGDITGSDVSDYLGVRLKHIPKIEEALAAARAG